MGCGSSKQQSSSSRHDSISNLSQPVYLYQQHVARGPTKLILKKHHFGKTFEVHDENQNLLFIIPARFFSIHGTKIICDNNKKPIGEIKKSNNPTKQWSELYTCTLPDNGNKSKNKAKTELFRTTVDHRFLATNPTRLTFRNKAQGGQEQYLEYFNTAFTRYNQVKYGNQVVATIKEKNLVIMDARTYEIEVAANMDMFLILGMAIIHDDIEERKRQAAARQNANQFNAGQY